MGVDAVKFQTFKTEKYVNDKDQLRYERLKKFELSKEDFYELSKFAKSKKLIFISTPFDIQSAIDLNECVDYFKISSGDNNYFHLIEKVLSFKTQVYVFFTVSCILAIEMAMQCNDKNKFLQKHLFNQRYVEEEQNYSILLSGVCYLS